MANDFGFEPDKPEPVATPTNELGFEADIGFEPEQAEPGFGRKFGYGWEKGKSDIRLLAEAAQVHAPDPTYEPTVLAGDDLPTQEYDESLPLEEFGKDFYELDPEGRRKRINEVNEKRLATRYADVIAASEQESFAATLGGVAGILSTPTTLLPVGSTYKAAAMIGGGLGLEQNLLEQYMEKGEVDPLQAAGMAAAGAVLAPAFLYVGRSLGNALGAKMNSRLESLANELVDDSQLAAYQAIASGIDTKAGPDSLKAIHAAMAQATGRSAEELQAALSMTGRTIRTTSVEKAQKLLFEASENAAALPVKDQKGYLRTIIGKGAKEGADIINNLIEPISSRIGKISEPVKNRLREYEFKVLQDTHRYLTTARETLAPLRKMSEDDRYITSKALFNRDFDMVKRMFTKYGFESDVLVKNYNEMMRAIGNDLISGGYKIVLKDNYFPRLVEDFEGLLGSLGKEQRDAITTEISKLISKHGSVDQITRTQIANKYLRGYLPKDGHVLSYSKTRRIETVSDKIMPYYADPEKALHDYIWKSVRDIQKRNFFGRHMQLKKGEIPDINDSVGKLVEEELAAGRIGADQLNELRGLLQARFVEGERAGNAVLSNLKNIMYMHTLGQTQSALTQLADIGVSAFMNGIIPTARGFVQSVTRSKKGIKAMEMGITDLAQELADMGRHPTAKFLERTLKFSGFKALDLLGKETYMNAALIKARKMAAATNTKGLKKLEEKYGQVFGKEFPNVIQDLRNGDISQNVKLLIFNELSNVQPITLSEMPKAYLNMPNGRIFYMLKSFTIRQLDLARREAAQEFAKGNYIAGASKFSGLMGTLVMGNMATGQLKKWIAGIPLDEEEWEDQVVENIIRNFGISAFVVKRLKRGEIGAAASDLLMPPAATFDAYMKVAKAWIDDEDMKSKGWETVPIVGRVLRYWVGNGVEEYLERRDRERSEEEREYYK